MPQEYSNVHPCHVLTKSSLSSPAITRVPISTRFGNMVDVRNRGALRALRQNGKQINEEAAPALVRLWSGDICRELTSNEARALANNLLEAARFVEMQNAH